MFYDHELPMKHLCWKEIFLQKRNSRTWKKPGNFVGAVGIPEMVSVETIFYSSPKIMWVSQRLLLAWSSTTLIWSLYESLLRKRGLLMEYKISEKQLLPDRFFCLVNVRMYFKCAAWTGIHVTGKMLKWSKSIESSDWSMLQWSSWGRI